MKVLWLPSIDSTNSEALRRLPELPSGTVLAAREQTAGRGQRGNSWFVEPGKNLTFSIVLKFREGELPASRAHELNYLISCAVAAFLQECGIEPRVKWPNDIYVGRRKICGILIENSLCGSSVAASVIGVGLNINQQEFPQVALATSLSLCTGREWELEPCLDALLGHFERLLALGASAARETYSSLLFQKGVPARYRDLLREEEFTGIIEGVEPDGRLRLRSTAEEERQYRFKEISYIL